MHRHRRLLHKPPRRVQARVRLVHFQVSVRFRRGLGVVLAAGLAPDGLTERFVAEGALLQPLRRPGSGRRWQNGKSPPSCHLKPTPPILFLLLLFSLQIEGVIRDDCSSC